MPSFNTNGVKKVHELIIYTEYTQRMMRFQKLTRNLFLNLHGHNVHRQQQQLSKFLMRYQQLASHTYCGAAGPVSRWRRSRNRLSACSALRCPDLWLQCSVSFVHGLEKTQLAGASFLNRARNSRCTVITDLDTSKRSTQKACSCCDAILKLAPRPRSKHEKRAAGSAWETWTVAAADGVRCARVRWEINFLLTFETASFFCVYPVYILWRCGPTRVRASSCLRFLGHTQWRITVGRTPLDEWPARRRDLYLKTHNTHNRQTSMPPVGFEPTISAGERPQTYALDRAAIGTGDLIICHYFFVCEIPQNTKRFQTQIRGYLPSMVSAFQDLYSTGIRWFILFRMLNRAFDLKSHMKLFLEMKGTPFPGLRHYDWMRE